MNAINIHNLYSQNSKIYFCKNIIYQALIFPIFWTKYWRIRTGHFKPQWKDRKAKYFLELHAADVT
jgi:hypothetical protein